MARVDYFQAFDWDWSDGFVRESARAQALRHRPKQTRVLSKICEADSVINFALWSMLPSGHPVGELWFETQTDLHSSIYLAYGGYFRQALGVLRFWLELAVQGIYFGAHYVGPTSRYRQWRAGTRQAPADMRKIAASLAGRSGKCFDADADSIFQHLDPVYAALCNHTHGRGLDVYDLQNGRDNVPRFLEQSFDTWWRGLVDVFATVCYLHRLFYVEPLCQYFAKYGSERRRAVVLGKALHAIVPEFALLVSSTQ